MLNAYFKRPLTLERYGSSPAGPHLDAFILWLEQRGYQPCRILRLIRGVHRFAHWGQDNGLGIEDLDAKALERFRHHLQVRQPLRYPSGSHRPVFMGARHFVTFLEALGLVSPTALVFPPPPEPELLEAFRQWMRTHRGTTEATLNTYRLPIIDLLQTLGEPPEDFEVKALRAFVLERAGRSGISHAKTVVQAVRIFYAFSSPLAGAHRAWTRRFLLLPIGAWLPFPSIYLPRRSNTYWLVVISPPPSGCETGQCSCSWRA